MKEIRQAFTFFVKLKIMWTLPIIMFENVLNTWKIPFHSVEYLNDTIGFYTKVLKITKLKTQQSNYFFVDMIAEKDIQ